MSVTALKEGAIPTEMDFLPVCAQSSLSVCNLKQSDVLSSAWFDLLLVCWVIQRWRKVRGRKSGAAE